MLPVIKTVGDVSATIPALLALCGLEGKAVNKVDRSAADTLVYPACLQAGDFKADSGLIPKYSVDLA